MASRAGLCGTSCGSMFTSVAQPHQYTIKHAQPQRRWRWHHHSHSDPHVQTHRRRGSQARTAALPAHHVVLAALPHALSACFTEACQRATDKTLAVALLIPIAVGLYALAYTLRPVPKQLKDEGRVFEDPRTGAVFETSEGQQPARDKNGELAFRPISYTSFPVEEGHEGERLRIDVGPCKDRSARTYVFDRLLPQPSQILAATMPRPLGIVFEFDEKRKRVVVADFIEGSNAGRMAKVAKLNKQKLDCSPQIGDVLRAVTCTNFVYPTKALFGAVPPQRHIVVYGCDNQGWNSVCGALKKGDFKDGEVTLVLERRVGSEDWVGSSWAGASQGSSTSASNASTSSLAE